MKPYRDTLALLAVLVLLGAIVYALEFRDSGQPAAPPPVGQTIWDLNEEDITALTAIDGGRTVELAKDESGAWVVASEGGAGADDWKVSSVISQAAKLRADRIVSEQVDDPGSFGLEPAQAGLRLTLTGGSTEELAVGSETPLGTGYYARRQGDERLYLVSTAFVGALRSLVTEPTPATPAPVSTPAFNPAPAATSTPQR